MLRCLDASPFCSATSLSLNLKGRKNLLCSPGLRRITVKQWTQASIVCLLVVAILGASHSSRFDRVGHKMMCACECGQVLLECNHVGCPISPGMIAEFAHADRSWGFGRLDTKLVRSEVWGNGLGPPRFAADSMTWRGSYRMRGSL